MTATPRVPEMPGHKRKRGGRPEEWKRNMAKLNRNSGKVDEPLNSPKNTPALCISASCKNDYFEEVTRASVEQLFKQFRGLGNDNLQNAQLPSISPS